MTITQGKVKEVKEENNSQNRINLLGSMVLVLLLLFSVTRIKRQPRISSKDSPRPALNGSWRQGFRSYI
jgi:hypothetical protein